LFLVAQVLCLVLSTLAATPPLTATQQDWLSKANRHEKAGWVYLHIEGSPRERGFQHGYLLAKEIAAGIKAIRGSWEYGTATKWEWLLKKATAMYEKKIDKENLAELDGIVEGMHAAGIATSRAEIIAYNDILELAWYWWPEELKKIKDGTEQPDKQSCSAFIATGSMTADGGIVLGHNTMLGYDEPLPNVVIDIQPERGHRLLMQTWAGWIHSGTDFFITDAGLVGAETTIGWFEGFDPKGTPEFSRMRRATQDADSIGEWCAIMKKGNNGGYANAWLLGDVKTGEIARLAVGSEIRRIREETERVLHRIEHRRGHENPPVRDQRSRHRHSRLESRPARALETTHGPIRRQDRRGKCQAIRGRPLRRLPRRGSPGRAVALRPLGDGEQTLSAMADGS
jgi:hypothetical protein